MLEPTLAIFPRPLRMSARSSCVSLRAVRREGIPGNGATKRLHDVGVLTEGGVGHLSTSDERQATGARHICPQGGLFEVLLRLEVSLCVEQTGGKEGSPKRSRGIGLCEGGSPPLHQSDQRLPFLFRGGRGRVPLRTTVVVLILGLLHGGNPQLAQVAPLVFGKRVCHKAKTRRTFGAAPKLSGTERFQDQEETVEKNSGRPRSPFNRNHGHQGPVEPRQARQKEPGVPDPETHLSVDDSESSSMSSSSSSSSSPRPPSSGPLVTAPSGHIGGGPLPAGPSTTVRGPQQEGTQCRPNPSLPVLTFKAAELVAIKQRQQATKAGESQLERRIQYRWPERK
jgi:hypothetical protein